MNTDTVTLPTPTFTLASWGWADVAADRAEPGARRPRAGGLPPRHRWACAAGIGAAWTFHCNQAAGSAKTAERLSSKESTLQIGAGLVA